MRKGHFIKKRGSFSSPLWRTEAQTSMVQAPLKVLSTVPRHGKKVWKFLSLSCLCCSALDRVFIAPINNHEQKPHGVPRVHFADVCISQSIMKGSQGRDLGQEPGGWHGGAGRGRVMLTALFSTVCSACCLVPSRNSRPPQWAEKTRHGLAHRQILRRHFL